MNIKHLVIVLLSLSLFFCACGTGNTATEQASSEGSSAETVTKADLETDTEKADTTAAAPAKDLFLADMEGLDGKGALALVIRGADLTNEPEEMSRYLLEDGALNLETGRHIDIRNEDLAAFLNEAGM